MGGVCSAGGAKKIDKRDVKFEDEKDASGFSGKLRSIASVGKKNKAEESYPTYPDMEMFESMPNHLYDSTELGLTISRELKPSTPVRTTSHKAHQVGSFLGKAGSVSLDKAVEVLDTLGSSMSNLNSGGFATGVHSRGNKITILSFEVANTIAKGGNLLQSVSDENIMFLKKEVLHSEGVQRLVSTDVNEFLRIAASDKREEFKVFSREVIRFGNLCKDPQWHSLDRYFLKLDSDTMGQKQFRGEAEYTMQELINLAHNTSELYHELHALDRFEQDYHRKLDELVSLNLPRKGESLSILHSELKHQRKLVRTLKKKSLWSKSLEEVVEKLVDIVTFIRQEIDEAFGNAYLGLVRVDIDLNKKPERLGEVGLALHYANLITQIDNIASRPTSLPPNVRDNLYHGLPPFVKTTLRRRLQTFNGQEELTVHQVKGEMEKILQWLVPVATDTTKAHQGFGWVGEWANSGNDFGKKGGGAQNNLIRLQTLYHAEKKKMDMYILELVTLLNRLINLVRYRDNVPKALPTRSPPGQTFLKEEIRSGQLSTEDKDLIEGVMRRKKLVPGISRSQEFVVTKKKKTKILANSKSMGSSPRRELEYPKVNILDILDGLGTGF